MAFGFQWYAERNDEIFPQLDTKALKYFTVSEKHLFDFSVPETILNQNAVDQNNLHWTEP